MPQLNRIQLCARFVSTTLALRWVTNCDYQFSHSKACVSLKTASHKQNVVVGMREIVSSYSPYPFNVTLAHLVEPNCIHAQNHALKLFRLVSRHGLVWFVTEMVQFQCCFNVKMLHSKSVWTKALVNSLHFYVLSAWISIRFYVKLEILYRYQAKDI